MGKLALLFPGQGSQKIGMGLEVYREYPAARERFTQASENLGYDLAKLCFDGPEENLKQTVYTQPALYVTGCATLDALRSRVTLSPFAAAGHSVGEYAAIYAAGAMSFEIGVDLVQKRARLMWEAGMARPGTMAAIIGLDGETAQAVCREAQDTGIVAVANYNCPGQVVISGEVPAVEKASALAKERGARTVISLSVSGAFHSPLMVSAGDALYPVLREAQFKQARFPVVVNVSAEYNKSGVDFAPFLTMQISGSVRWEESMRLLIADGVDTFLEIGVGSVLAGLMKRIDRSVKVISVENLESLEAAVELVQSMNSGNDS